MTELLNEKQSREERMNGLKCRLPTGPEAVPQLKVTHGPSASSVLPASLSPWAEGRERWTVGPRLGSCCRDSHLRVWDAPCGIKSPERELLCGDAQSSLEWLSPSCLKHWPLFQAFSDLPLFPFPRPTAFQAGAVGRHLQPWGHTKLLVFH